MKVSFDIDLAVKTNFASSTGKTLCGTGGVGFSVQSQMRLPRFLQGEKALTQGLFVEISERLRFSIE